MIARCNNCLDEFDVSKKDVLTKSIDGLEMQYICCPSCGAKYVVFASDKEMDELVNDGIKLQKKYQLARKCRFREKTIREIEAELANIRAKQKALLPKLKKQAEKLLKNDEDEEEKP